MKWYLLVPVAVVACVLLGIALWEANASSQVGQAVSGAQAADVRAGACPKINQITCPNGTGKCAAKTVIVFDSKGTAANVQGTAYCGGTAPNCGDYWSIPLACYN